MSDDVNTPPIGASVWEREMYAYLTEHVQREGKMLGEYVTAAETTPSKALSFLIRLLAEDERRHHQLINDLAASLKSEAEFRREEPVIPRLDFDADTSGRVRELTRELLEGEKSDLKEMKRLRKNLRTVQDYTLWALLVDVIMRDTEKHIAILQFALDHSEPRH